MVPEAFPFPAIGQAGFHFPLIGLATLMAEIPHKVVSPTFERQALTILGAKNELDAPDFDPVDYVNRFFPNGKSKKVRAR